MTLIPSRRSWLIAFIRSQQASPFFSNQVFQCPLVRYRIRRARFPKTKDFTAQPSLNIDLVLELFRCQWIDQRPNCIAVGPSGTGKTNVALALGLTAHQKGYGLAFMKAATNVHEPMEARDERRLRALQKHVSTWKLLIVEELSNVPLTAVDPEFLREAFSQGYERGATLVTNKKTIKQNRTKGLTTPF